VPRCVWVRHAAENVSSANQLHEECGDECQEDNPDPKVSLERIEQRLQRCAWQKINKWFDGWCQSSCTVSVERHVIGSHVCWTSNPNTFVYPNSTRGRGTALLECNTLTMNSVTALMTSHNIDYPNSTPRVQSSD
jgi:hypothetical protein